MCSSDLPPLYGLHEGALEPCNIGHFAHHGSTAFRLLAAYYLRLDIEGLQPQAEVGPDAEESLTHDDERRNVEDEVRGQIMKFQPVVEPQSAEEVVEENYPLVRFWGRNDLPRSEQLMRDIRG